MNKVPDDVWQTIFASIPSKSIDWRRVHRRNCGYFLRSLNPFFVHRIDEDAKAFAAFKKSVVKSLCDFSKRVEELTILTKIVALRVARRDSEMAFVNEFVLNEKIEEARSVSFAQGSAKLVELCHEISRFKIYLETLYAATKKMFDQSFDKDKFVQAIKESGLTSHRPTMMHANMWAQRLFTNIQRDRGMWRRQLRRDGIVLSKLTSR